MSAINSDYCISLTEAVIEYQPYQTGKVVYQYPGEESQEIKSQNCGNLTYQLTEETLQTCSGQRFLFNSKIENGQVLNRYGRTCVWELYNQEFLSLELWGVIEVEFLNYELFSTSGCRTIVNSSNKIGGYGKVVVISDEDDESTERKENIIFDNQYFSSSKVLVDHQTFLYQISPLDGGCPPQCKFEVFEDGDLIYQEIRQECPIVEVIDPQLSPDFKTVKIGKQAATETIKIIDYGVSIDGRLDPPVGYHNIPDSCLNIYVIAINLFNNNSSGNYYSNPLRFVRQICSDFGCPPPEFNVICSESQECPSGTCAVKCNGHICCYDKNGIAVTNFSNNE